ncbi:MAG TPA: peptidase [Ruminococcaceae bacterium]|jgi:Zn-dependent membrane protease YugP|nr:peptidase [Oscillospiraceae bacterium]
MVQTLISTAARHTNFLSVGYTTAYFLCILAFIFALICSLTVKTTFNKYNRIGSRRGITAAEVARMILDRNGLYNVHVERISGNLTDNYNPRTNIVSLSDSVYNSTSLAAIGVAAHECGHAVQHAQDYVPIKIRTAVFPLAQLGSSMYFIVFIVGLIFSFEPLVDAGIILFLFVVLFQLVTLPVEFNASRRALSTIRSEGILEQDEMYGARRTLTAAAMTYVASLAVSFTQLLRLLAIRNNRR